jgi:Kef-type K+ transport system membrane component KefB
MTFTNPVSFPSRDALALFFNSTVAVLGFLHSSSGVMNLWTELGIVGLGVVVAAGSSILRLKKNFDWVMVFFGTDGFVLPVSLGGLSYCYGY